jgi:hypothetical protein
VNPVLRTSSTNFGDGNERTLIVYDDGTLELWHEPDADSVGQTGNALAPAHRPRCCTSWPSGSRTPTSASAWESLARKATRSVGSGNVLVGGSQVVAFSFDESTDVLLCDNRDAECAEDPSAARSASAATRRR